VARSRAAYLSGEIDASTFLSLSVRLREKDWSLKDFFDFPMTLLERCLEKLSEFEARLPNMFALRLDA
jgi:hypothetical protein